MDENDKKIEELGKKIDEIKERNGDVLSKDTGDDGDARAKGMSIGIRIGVELFSAILVGTAIGYGLDSWLDTTPLFLIIFLLLGVAAGFLNVWRSYNKE